MTELEKIAYAKSFIDKLANGINPLDDTPIPEEDIANNVRLSRCFFYVSDILRQVIEKEIKKLPKEKKPQRVPFSLTPEEVDNFKCADIPITITAMSRKINLLAGDIKAKNMQKFSYRKLEQWLFDVNLIEWRKWENGKYKKFPTAEGEELGFILKIWENYGRRAPVVYFTEAAQKLIIDNIEAVISTEQRDDSYHMSEIEESDD